MLSKFIYRFVAVVLLALVMQVGYSQNYVGADAAINILDDAIEHLQTDIDNFPANTGLLQSQSALNSDKIDLQMMKTVRDEIDVQKDVKLVMDAWYENAESETADRKTKLILALDKVKDLLS